MTKDPYTDPDMIMALELDPENEVLLAEYAIQTGGVQLGLTNSGGGPALPQLDLSNVVGEIGGVTGGPISGGSGDIPIDGPEV